MASRLRGRRTSTTRPWSTRQLFGDPDRATAGGNDGGVVEDRQGNLQQRVSLEQGVGVDHADVRMAGRVDAGVERVRPPAVLLVHEVSARFVRET